MDTDVSGLEAKYGIPDGLYAGIINAGERSSPTAVSPKGAIGQAQLMPSTARDLGVDPTDPEQNLDGGARYTAQLWKKYKDPSLVAAAYNAGPGAVDSHGGVPPYPETKSYVDRVTGAMSDPTTNMPSPDSVQGGYGGAAKPSSGAPTSPSAAPATDEPPSAADVINSYGSVKPGSGQVVYAGSNTPVSAAQEATALALFKAGKFDPNAKPGDPGYVMAESEGATAPPGVAKIGVDGTFTPAADAPVTTAGTLKAAASGALNSVMTGANALSDPAALVGTGADIGSGLVNYFGQKVGLINGDQKAALNAKDQAGRRAILGPTTTEQQNAMGLYHAPQNAVERGANIVGASVPALPAGALAVARGAVGTFAGSEGVRAAGGGPEAQQLGGILGGGVAGALPEAVAGPVQSIAAAGTNAFSKTVSPFAARFSTDAAETQAGRTLADNTTDLPATRNALAPGPQEIVPGSKPTTFQQTGDSGLGALERGAAVRNPQAFADVRGSQNAARVSALTGIQSGADPAAVSQFVTSKLNEIDASTQAAVDQATQAAQAKASGLGGQAPEASGAALRTAIADAQQAGQQQVSALYKAIDPDGKLTGNVQGTKAAAKQVLGEMQPTSAPMSSSEAQAFQAASSMPDVAPLKALTELRTNVGAQMATELRNSGSTPTYARLSRLYGAIQDNLSQTIADKVASDNAQVQSGALPVQQSAAAQLAEYQSAAARQGLAITYGRGSGSVPPAEQPRAGSPAVAGVLRTDVPGGGQSVDAPSGAGVQGQGAVPQVTQPNIDTGTLDQLNAASAASKAQHATFDAKPVASVLKTTGQRGNFAVPDSAVPQQVWTGRPGELEAVQAAVKAGGPAAETVIADHAAADLRATATNPDGSINPVKFAAWQAKHAGGLKALPPEIQARFADAASAGQAVGDAAVARATALKAAQTGAVAKVMGLTEPEDVTRQIGTILNSQNSVSNMKALAAAVESDPAAKAGLRQAVADYMTGRFLGNTEAGTSGTAQIKADAFQTFIGQNKAALAKVFTPEERGRLNEIAQDIRRSKLSETALKIPGGSNTAQDQFAAARGTAPRVQRSVLDIIGASLGAAVGQHIHGVGAPFGAAFGGAGADFVQQLRSAGIDRVDQLVTRALIDPAVAKTLLDKVSVAKGSPVPAQAIRPKIAALVSALSAVNSAPKPAPALRSSLPDNAFSTGRLPPRSVVALPNSMSQTGGIH